MTINYTTKRGATMSRIIDAQTAKSEIVKMIKRGIECRFYHGDWWSSERIEAGATWKQAGRWHWYLDPDAD